MEVLRGSEALAEQLGADDAAVLVAHQTAVSLVRKDERAHRPDHARKYQARQDDEEHGQREGGAKVFHESSNSSQMQEDQQTIDEPDGGERSDHSAYAVEQQIALERRDGASRAVGDAAQRKGNQRNDNQRR